MSIGIAESKFSVSRDSPKELVDKYPELWNKLAKQRYAWLQLPWLIVFLLVIGIAFWPFAIIFLGFWLWQRNAPDLFVCKIVELIISLFFIFLVLIIFAFEGNLAGGPYIPMLITGVVIFLYEGSARSWHYLFNYMLLESCEFYEIAISNKWVTERTVCREKTKLPAMIALSGVTLSIVVVAVLELIG
ncbi:MAG: hypothetical protein SVR94_16425 [Pseudomonadota bacterium]|nr:hypothetical protein [Pseudomonadota bacterium]